MIFPWTLNLGAYVKELIRSAIQAVIDSIPGGILKQLIIPKGWVEEAATNLTPRELYSLWIVDTEGMLVYTFIIFMVGIFIGAAIKELKQK